MRFKAHITAMIVILLSGVVRAQTGQWIEHDLDLDGSGDLLYECGATTVVVMREQSANLRFFDAIGGAWVEENTVHPQSWFYLSAVGHTALAVSDSFIVAYNALSSSAHMLRYEGERLCDDEGRTSYRCGERLAYLGTDEYLYVFDVDLDAWQMLAWDVPGDMSRCRSTVGDDYVGVSLHRPFSQASPSIAYSLNHHAFAQSEIGTPLGPENNPLNHGFAGRNLYAEPGLVGYSSITNEFTHVQLVDTHYVWATPTQQALSERTVYAGMSVPGVASRDRSYYLFGYDTVRGAWSSDVIPPRLPPYSEFETDLIVGGRFAAIAYVKEDLNDIPHQYCHVYSGVDGSITRHETPFWGVGFFHGGTTLVMLQRNRGWGLDVSTGLTSTSYFSNKDYIGLTTMGQQFATIVTYTPTESTMDLFAYHGPTNNWSSITTCMNAYTDVPAGTHVYAHLWSNPVLTATFFSGYHGTYDQAVFAAGGSSDLGRSDHLAYVHTVHGGCLYDARRGNLQLADFSFEPETSVGQSVFIGADDAVGRAVGYSSNTGTWAFANLDATPHIGEAVNNVGWVSDAWPAQTIHAFNGLHASWVSLELDGELQDIVTGGRTIFAFTPTTLFAFDPEALAVPIDDPGPGEPTPGRPAVMALHPAHPNPFNPSTQFAFDLPRPGPFTLRVHDLRGRVVRTLAEGAAPAGSHTATWNGRDDDGRALPSGAYVIRLEAEGHAATRRATLLK